MLDERERGREAGGMRETKKRGGKRGVGVRVGWGERGSVLCNQMRRRHRCVWKTLHLIVDLCPGVHRFGTVQALQAVHEMLVSGCKLVKVNLQSDDRGHTTQKQETWERTANLRRVEVTSVSSLIAKLRRESGSVYLKH